MLVEISDLIANLSLTGLLLTAAMFTFAVSEVNISNGLQTLQMGPLSSPDDPVGLWS